MNVGKISNNKKHGLSRSYCYGDSNVTINAGKFANNGGVGVFTKDFKGNATADMLTSDSSVYK